MSQSDQSNYVAFWVLYAVVIVLCVAVVVLQGQAQMIAFGTWLLAAGVDVVLLVRGLLR